MARYVALLRGINVGGKNIIKMADLRACLTEGGLADVATYIQSGNVAFRGAGGARALTTRVEDLLRRRFGYDGWVLLRNRAQLRAVVAQAPDGYGDRTDRHRYDVIFLRDETPAAAMDVLPRRPGVDEAWPGPGVLYFSRVKSRASKSRLSKLASLPIYQKVTVRNWNTTRTLLAMV
ncbi:MAG: DUF1697 domain-containing protein [Myxococcota bacterium]